MEFQKSLQEKLGEHDPSEVDELILDDLYSGIEEFSNDHKKTLELYNSLLNLSLNALGLKSLKNFPKIPELRILEIRGNSLNGNDLKDLKALYPNLYKLKLGENPIKSLDVFKPLADFPQLKKIELQDTDVTKKDTYRDELFKMLNNVEIIDKMSREGDEIDSTIYDEEDGEFEDDEFEGEEFDEEDDFEDEEGEDFDDEDEESEEPVRNKNVKKQRKE